MIGSGQACGFAQINSIVAARVGRDDPLRVHSGFLLDRGS